MKIAVAGATGVLGHYVAKSARARGHDVLPLARSVGIDLRTGVGLAEALEGVDTVIDTTNVATQRASVAADFFGSVTANLLAAEHAAEVRHHVAISIVGVDAVALGYYRAKVLQERLIADGPVPWTVLRATQFHEFAEQALSFMRVGPVSLVPRMSTQTVAASEVAAHLVDLCEAVPAGRAPDLAGPEKNQMVDLARHMIESRHERRRVVGVRLPGAAGRAMSAGALRPASAGPRGAITFDAWLAAR